MTYLRHSSRMVKQTVFEYLKTQLDALDWTSSSAAARPFQAAQVTLYDTIAKESEARSKVVAGYVALTLGNESGVTEEELGGPLGSTQQPMAIDLVMDSQGAAHALACDIRDIFLGCFTGGQRMLFIKDYSSDPNGVENTAYAIEFVQVQMTPSLEFEFWWTVHIGAILYAPQVIY